MYGPRRAKRLELLDIGVLSLNESLRLEGIPGGVSKPSSDCVQMKVSPSFGAGVLIRRSVAEVSPSVE
eukprot:COSAG03_NODE_1541_length_3905_cov_6.605360_2_plen_68_part_00